MSKKSLSFQVKNLKFETSEKANWLPFNGTCLFTDVPSDGIPSGGIDKPIAFPHEEVQKALDTMVDMGVNCEFPDDLFDCPDEMFSGHNSRFKIGVVTQSDLKSNEMAITGGLWSMDFPDVCDVFVSAKKALGFSVEVMFTAIDKGDHYDAIDIEFIGVAILFADKAAFKRTYIAAQEKHKGGNKDMNEEQLKKLLGEFSASINKVISDSVEGVKAEFSEQLTKVAEDVSKVSAEFEAQKAEKEAAEKAEKEAAELAAKKAEEEKLAQEKAAKEKAELEAKQKKEAEELEAKRKSMAFSGIKPRFSGETEKQKAVLSDTALSPSEKFQQLLYLREQPAE